MKIYPSTTVLRPSLMVFGGAGILIVLLIIIYNLFHTMHNLHNEKNNTGDVQKSQTISIATQTDTQWYQEAQSTPKPIEKNIEGTNPSLRRNDGSPNTTLNPSLQQPVSNNQEDTKAMSAPITSNQLTWDQVVGNSQSNAAQAMHQMPSSNSNSVSASFTSSSTPDQNMQNEKNDFIQAAQSQSDIYLQTTVNNPISKYEIQAGTHIPAELITGINSDLPGQITAQVDENVYDSIAGRYILIPQGSTLVGLYDSHVSYGQQRVQVVWKRLRFPNGQSIDLQGMPGADVEGYSGFKDQVDNHYGKIFTSVILVSILAAGGQLAQPQQSNNPFVAPTVGQTLAQSLGTNIANTGTMITQKNINIQPTLKIRKAYQFNVEITKDIVFPGPYTSQDFTMG